ncbi:hypothetical protein SSP35_07_01370 [Streptomyces sp. NBRC 110611]|uniref:hypothetical protein n=1 Tax=Streptomyces sp. NBRC 110611 TaxID=1621259 RepID=UPI00083635E1|nr:hypothetical protein [Streptomyces sp. NBRC 110611]GAU68335.1 hypothetical protein SSP35_07_01370 [Streptomyces sp. NBRC 110611]
MCPKPHTRPPARDRDHHATVLAAVLLAASAAALAYVLLGGHHGAVEEADTDTDAAPLSGVLA